MHCRYILKYGVSTMNPITIKLAGVTIEVSGPGSADVVRHLLSSGANTASTAPADTLLGVSEVAEALGCKRQTVWAWDRNGALPAPHSVSPRGRKLWRAGTIAAWKAAPPTVRLLRRLKPTALPV